jgi:hypothetical protein
MKFVIALCVYRIAFQIRNVDKKWFFRNYGGQVYRLVAYTLLEKSIGDSDDTQAKT